MSIYESNGDLKPPCEWTDEDIAEAQLKADAEREDREDDRRLDNET